MGIATDGLTLVVKYSHPVYSLILMHTHEIEPILLLRTRLIEFHFTIPKGPKEALVSHIAHAV